ncbi:MAG TPA: hypothetical protein VFM12_01465, partial [Gemmatimonadales bacterium]|nr:hypothetical protein [Gemmatimonadales bacterium]
HEAVRAQMAATGENPDDFRAATAHVGGQDFAGCWRPDFDAGKVILLYEDGDAGALPFTDFKPTPEA